MVNWAVWCQLFSLSLAKDVHGLRVICWDEFPVVWSYAFVCCLFFALVQLFVNKEVRRRRKESNKPGGLVVNGLPTKEPSPGVHSLPSGFGKLVAVIQMSPRSSSSAATTAAAHCSSHSAFGSVSSGEFKVMSSTVTPYSLVHSPIRRANATTTSSVPTRLSNVVAPSVCISGLRSRSWSMTFLFSASETFDGTAIVIGVISSTPLALSDRREVNQL